MKMKVGRIPGNVTELLPPVCAVEARRLIEVRRDVLHAGQEEHHQETPPVPVVDEPNCGKDGIWATKKRLVKSRDAEIRQECGDAPVWAQETTPKCRRYDTW